MQNNARIMLIILSFLFINPIESYSTIWNYDVSGTITDRDYLKEFTVTGNFLIDDTFRSWDGNLTPAPETSIEENPYGGTFSYFIAGYSLEISEQLYPTNFHNFSGDTGHFYIEQLPQGGNGDLMWHLGNGSENWAEWVGQWFLSYNNDMTPYDWPNQIDELAPVIHLSSFLHKASDPVLSSNVNTDIWLTRTTPLPVPEPNPILLLGVGLIGIASLSRKKIYK